MLNNQREQLAQSQVHHVEQQAALPTMPPTYVARPGWFDDGHGVIRWFDGLHWTPYTR
jgi:hypothetical protein